MLFYTLLSGQIKSWWHIDILRVLLYCCVIEYFQYSFNRWHISGTVKQQEHVSTLLQSDNLICSYGNAYNSSAVKQLARVCAWRYDLSDWLSIFCNTIRFVQTATLTYRRREATGSSLCITILTTIFHYDVINPDNCQTCPKIGLICKFCKDTFGTPL